MIRVVVAGATGRLGSLVCDLVAESDEMELVAAVVSENGGNVGTDVHGVTAVGPSSIPDVTVDADVYVDLTSPLAATENLSSVRGVNCVIGTTAIPEDAMAAFSSSLVDDGRSAVVTPNFSIGVNVFWKACAMLAGALPGYDIEVIERHHNRKRDAPSGTAAKTVDVLMGASRASGVTHGREGVVGPRGDEIGVHAVRAGDIVGDHTVVFAGRKEVLELTHRAISREAFAEGCIEAIRWVAGRDDGGVHGMDEVLGL